MEKKRCEVPWRRVTSLPVGSDLLMPPLPPAPPRWILDEICMADARQQGIKEEGVGAAGSGRGEGWGGWGGGVSVGLPFERSSWVS